MASGSGRWWSLVVSSCGWHGEEFRHFHSQRKSHKTVRGASLPVLPRAMKFASVDRIFHDKNHRGMSKVDYPDDFPSKSACFDPG
jgi:hypothetical protein